MISTPSRETPRDSAIAWTATSSPRIWIASGSRRNWPIASTTRASTPSANSLRCTSGSERALEVRDRHRELDPRERAQAEVFREPTRGRDRAEWTLAGLGDSSPNDLVVRHGSLLGELERHHGKVRGLDHVERDRDRQHRVQLRDRLRRALDAADDRLREHALGELDMAVD